jgi:aldehyde dehydrogenase (NAD+)
LITGRRRFVRFRSISRRSVLGRNGQDSVLDSIDEESAMGAAVSGTDELRARAEAALVRCGVEVGAVKGDGLAARTPITGAELFGLRGGTSAEVDRAVEVAHEAFRVWRLTPAPVRGALVKRLGELVGEHKADLADLVTVEAGKIRSEALGEVQEMIDVCDFAVGLSRQLYGRTMPSERAGHRLMETWHPLGVVGVISAFNFPVAVWAWNAAVALVCGDTVVWKPSELTPLTALACTALLDRAIGETGAPAGLSRLVLGTAEIGTRLVDSPLVPLISATGSTRMGREVGPRVAARFGRSILELGGNNAAVVTPSADLDLTVNAVVFAAAGTAGQRCTTLRRLIVHDDVADAVVERLGVAYGRLPVGDPLRESTLVGPLVNEAAHSRMRAALGRAAEEGGALCAGGERQLADAAPDGYYVRPALVRMPAQTAVVREETFAPILYVLTYRDLDEAIRLHNDVPQGLSSGIFTADQGEAERFLAADGADCGIVNVNIGTSGAEIGGAFGGEKETGGGRESGSDAWRAYMRRATNTVNYSGRVALAQGVDFSQ